MKIIRAKDYKDMSRKAANIISAQVIMKPNCVLGLATGGTPVGAYAQLVDWYNKGDLDFSEVTTVNLDEYRGLPKEHPESYWSFMHKNLFDKVNIRPEAIHLPDGTNPDAADACKKYNEIIHSVGGIDLQLLGLGPNGHIGFNEPGEAFELETHCVNLTPATIEANKRFFDGNEDLVPKQAYTMGIKTIMVTGDNPLTAAAIAAEAGVDDFLAEATPEGKLEKIREFQREGHLVAMTGDGTNDAPALAQADVAVAMNTGTQAAKEAGNMVDLDSSPTKLIEVVRIGKQLLMTRGSLTTFSVANDVAKYFAIIPALFSPIYPGLGALNILGLASPLSAVLSAIIYNALVIVALIPAALKGVKYREVPSGQLLTHNLLVWGLGGIVAPFVFIKLIDMLLAFCGIM